jgi:predicted nuclease of predicted toxin-antitoxin system
MIITNDDDFINYSTIYGYPPKIVIMKTGNLRRIYVQELLFKYLDDIKLLHKSSETGILEIFGKY